jgi:pSer/pThr/pTyr-binding forkhead associated (FHA) protein
MSSVMVVRLVPIEDGPLISLDRPIVFVGRHADCDVRIDSKKISRRHCCIIQLENRLVIRDLGSTNGIYCNGQRVEEAELTAHDEVQIANIRYKIVVNDSVSGPPRNDGGIAPGLAPEQGGNVVPDDVHRPPLEPPLRLDN